MTIFSLVCFPLTAQKMALTIAYLKSILKNFKLAEALVYQNILILSRDPVLLNYQHAFTIAHPQGREA
jgi:hypothetical protein